MTAARIRRLTLTNFRSYHAAQIDVGASLVVLIGPNGAGKTNLIEAISLLAPGRGLRRATLDELAFAEGDGSWAVSCDVEGALGLATLGTGIEPPVGEAAPTTRKCRIDREPVSLRHRLRRPPARDLAGSGDGHAVQRPGLGAPALPRPAGAGGRRRAFQPRVARWSARCARATGCWRSRGPIRTGSTPSSTRPPSSRSRSRRSAPRRWRACKARWPRGAIRPRRFPPPRSRSTAGWRSSCRSHPAAEIEDRYRAVLQGQPRPRRRRRPHARRPAPHRSRRWRSPPRTFRPPMPRPASRRRC